MKPALEPETPIRAPHFDHLARAYRWMEWLSFGPWLWWCRAAFLSQMARSRRALTFGDGDGRFTARLLAANPQIHVEAVDASPGMLARLKQNAGSHAQRVHTVVADARSWKPDAGESFDLVYTHFFLDCLTDEEAGQLARQVSAVLTPDGAWIVSEFAIPRGGLGRILGRPLVAFLYRAFGLLTGLAVRRLPDHRAALTAAGLKQEARREWLLGVLVSELWTRASGS